MHARNLIFLFALIAPFCPAADESPRSGFLPDDVYAHLETVETRKDSNARRWIGPKLSFANYQKVMVDEVVLYPEPEPGPQVSADTLEAIREYTTAVLRDKVGQLVNLAWEPGPGVLRMKAAITGVSIETEGMKAYEVLPVTAIFGGIKAMTGTRDRDVRVLFEGVFEDSVTGEIVGAMMRSVEGEDLKGKKDQLTLEDMKTSIDAATEEGSAAFEGVFSEQ